MIIRQERDGDHEAVASVTTQAFAVAEHSGGTEAEIVARLQASESLKLSLIAEDDEAIVGHAAFSPPVSCRASWLGNQAVDSCSAHRARRASGRTR